MLRIIPDLPERVVGVTASGQVTAEDYESVVFPAVRAALKESEGIRFLYHLGPAFSGFTAGAMWDDMKLGLEHRHSWRRVAVVSDHGWVDGALRLFAFAAPCPIKLFPESEMTEAKRWVTG